jgi:hypothetical protein
MGELARHVGEFEQANPVSSHDNLAKYLDDLEVMLRSAAIMFRQDGNIAGVWIRKRRPLSGAMTHLRERIGFGHRTKVHGRHGSKALVRAADKVAKLAKIHETFQEKEVTAKRAALARAAAQTRNAVRKGR